MTGEELLAKTGPALEELEGYGMLAAYAAKAAAQELVTSWKAAVHDGPVNVNTLLEDIDDTITELRAFKKLVGG